MIEISGNLLPEDYVHAQYLHLRPRRTFKILGFLILIAVTWAAWYMFFGGGSNVPGATKLMLPAAGIYLLFFFFAYIPWKTRRTYRQQKSLQREFRICFGDAGLSAENEIGNATTPWSDYTKWKENEHLFLLYVSDPVYHMIPKRLFNDSDDVSQLRQILSASVSRDAA